MKIMNSLFGLGLTSLFVLLGIYVLNTQETILARITGIACIVFFGGLLIWGIALKVRQR